MGTWYCVTTYCDDANAPQLHIELVTLFECDPGDTGVSVIPGDPGDVFILVPTGWQVYDPLVVAVLEAHDPEVLTEAQEIQAFNDGAAEHIPTLDFDNYLSQVDAITNLAEAKTFLTKMVKKLAALCRALNYNVTITDYDGGS
jgi:hypothetical protein